jgi:hypothetical protein
MSAVNLVACSTRRSQLNTPHARPHTLLFTLMSAPSCAISATVAVWPFPAAAMSGVQPCCILHPSATLPQRSAACLPHATPVHLSRPARAAAAGTHINARVDVRAKSHELDDRGRVAVGSSQRQRSLAKLAPEPRSSHSRRGSEACGWRCDTGSASLGSAPRRTSSDATFVWPWRAAWRSGLS